LCCGDGTDGRTEASGSVRKEPHQRSIAKLSFSPERVLYRRGRGASMVRYRSESEGRFMGCYPYATRTCRITSVPRSSPHSLLPRLAKKAVNSLPTVEPSLIRPAPPRLAVEERHKVLSPYQHLPHRHPGGDEAKGCRVDEHRARRAGRVDERGRVGQAHRFGEGRFLEGS
jgi:hypothetical protein